MRPVKHKGCNAVYLGNGKEVGDLHCIRQYPGRIDVVYELDEDDRAVIAQGGKIMLGIHTEPIPPVSIMTIPKGMCEPVEDHPFNVLESAIDNEFGE